MNNIRYDMMCNDARSESLLNPYLSQARLPHVRLENCPRPRLATTSATRLTASVSARLLLRLSHASLGARVTCATSLLRPSRTP